MIESKSFGSKLFDIVNVIILVILAFSCLYPIWYTFCMSIFEKLAVESGLVTFYPVGFSTKSYELIMSDNRFWMAFWTSVKRVFVGTALSMVAMVLMAYPLSKSTRDFKARNIFMWILVFTMLFNGGTVPWYITCANLGLIDSFWALVLCGGIGVFNVILIMNFFKGLPAELEEAAMIDGAGPWRTLVQIIVPCSVPVLATIILFTSVNFWNEYFQGLVLMNKVENYPLQTYIKQIMVSIPVGVTLTAEQYQQLAQNSNRALDAAKVFIAMIPMLIVYPFLQRYFVTGITIGAVKE